MGVKVGCFRITYQNGKETFVPYNEFYERDNNYRQKLKTAADNEEIKLSCACQDCTELELTITKNHVIRVKTNNNQTQHTPSCPKSEVYTEWAANHKDGLLSIGEDGRLCFRISVPSGIKTEGGSGSSSSSESKGNSAKQRANVIDLVMNVNYYAWLKQTYSIKKQIKDARVQGNKPEWQYKSFEDFTRLFFGVTGDIDIYWQQALMPLKNICYRTDTFFQSDYRYKYLVYAQIDKLSEYKEKRKYQYITLRMRGDKSPNKATVRVQTENFSLEDFESLNGLIRSNKRIILTGYARHDSFLDKNTNETSNWITMLNFACLETSENGLILRHEYEKELVDELCKRRILFKKSLLPLENYGGFTPTAIIEQQNGKDIIIDVCQTGQEYTKRQQYTENNPEYEILLYKKNENVDNVVDDLFALFDANKK